MSVARAPRRNALGTWRPARGAFDRAAAAHLVRRAGFGTPPGRVEEVLAAGFPAAVDVALAPDAHDAALVNGVRALLPAGQLGPLQAWWMALILAGGAPLRERVTLMWHDHFATSHDKVGDVRLIHRQNELFRQEGLGDFRALLHAVAKDPAMLVWLDGNANRRGHPNENFAREVMELFTLGIGNYDEEDVREAARAFTGWGTKGRAFHRREAEHDPGTKSVLGQRGAWRGEDVIDLILAHPACPRHVARRLLEEFVASRPEPGWIDETARVLVENEWHVGRTVRRILASELFFSAAARRSRIAGPVELVAGAAHTLSASVAPSIAVEAAGEMGQSLFRPPSVKGWDGMRTWINAGTWVARHNALVRLAEAQVRGTKRLRVDLRAAYGAPATAAEVPAAALRTLLPDVEDEAYASVLREAAGRSGTLDAALAAVTALVLTSPEYQLT